MADSVEQAPRATVKVAILVGGAVVLHVILNAVFYGLSAAYFADRAEVYGPTSVDEITGVRIAFAGMSLVLVAVAAVAVRVPRLVGHAIPLLAGLASLAAAVGAYAKGLYIVLSATLFLIGVMLPLLTWKSWQRRRAGWAFLCGMCAMLAVVTLFGATKVRGVLDISLWHAMIIPGLLAIGTAALSMIRTEYRES